MTALRRLVSLAASLAALSLALLLAPAGASARTFYVDAAKGSDLFGSTLSQNPSFPLRTIKVAIGYAVGGDTVMVKPGTYMESVESKRDGTPAAPIVLHSTTVGGAVIQPPAGTNGFFVSHSYHTIDGFTVKQAVTGMKLGAHDGGNGPVVGLLIENNTVKNCTNNGIQVTNGLSVEIAFNTVFGNAQNGISYSGNASLIHDNIVHDNGQFGIYVKDGVDHQVFNNQAFANASADLQIAGSLLASAKTYYVAPGGGSDELAPGTNYAEVSFGSFVYALPVSGFEPQGGDVWTYTAPGQQLASGTFTKLPNGSVDMTVTASGLNLSYSDSPISVGVRIGDDFGSSQVSLQGTIQFSP